jgi:hypothetical protein
MTSQPRRPEKVSARLRNIASISLGKKDAYEPSISFNIAIPAPLYTLNAIRIDGTPRFSSSVNEGA